MLGIFLLAMLTFETLIIESSLGYKYLILSYIYPTLVSSISKRLVFPDAL